MWGNTDISPNILIPHPGRDLDLDTYVYNTCVLELVPGPPRAHSPIKIVCDSRGPRGVWAVYSACLARLIALGLVGCGESRACLSLLSSGLEAQHHPHHHHSIITTHQSPSASEVEAGGEWVRFLSVSFSGEYVRQATGYSLRTDYTLLLQLLLQQ